MTYTIQVSIVKSDKSGRGVVMEWTTNDTSLADLICKARGVLDLHKNCTIPGLTAVDPLNAAERCCPPEVDPAA